MLAAMICEVWERIRACTGYLRKSGEAAHEVVELLQLHSARAVRVDCLKLGPHVGVAHHLLPEECKRRLHLADGEEPTCQVRKPVHVYFARKPVEETRVGGQIRTRARTAGRIKDVPCCQDRIRRRRAEHRTKHC